MAVRIADSEAEALLQERKFVPEDYRAQLARARDKPGHRQGSVEVRGENGHEFRIAFRQSKHNPLDFSVFLQYRPQGSGEYIRLRRYNADHGPHTNRIEGTRLTGPHIHMITERYQDLGGDPDSFAVPSDAFHDLRSALDLLMREMNCEAQPEDQLTLFDEGEP